MSTKLFVGNLSYQASENDLKELFSQAGTVESVKIITDTYTGQPRGFGFVEMSTSAEAKNAVSLLNDKPLNDRNITVSEARPRPERGGSGGGGGGRRPSGGRGGSGGGGNRRR
ncbi:MAG: RNA-binding protein [Nitrospirae bacterium]|nr:RNA-binding protein [Nitrospirota bacterium]